MAGRVALGGVCRIELGALFVAEADFRDYVVRSCFRALLGNSWPRYLQATLGALSIDLSSWWLEPGMSRIVSISKYHDGGQCVVQRTFKGLQVQLSSSFT